MPDTVAPLIGATRQIGSTRFRWDHRWSMTALEAIVKDSDGSVRAAYRSAKGDAKRRGIPFALTFDEWCGIWVDSGKWAQRGWRKGQYCMSRFGDKGGYEVGNVRICLAEENRAERNQNYPRYGKQGNRWLFFKTQRPRETKCRFRWLRKPLNDDGMDLVSLSEMDRQCRIP